MKGFLIVLLSASLHAATYYVASTGNDGNAGSSGSPWLTLSHAVNTVVCGDTINVVANGSTVSGDANLPYFPNCGLTTTVQSSALSHFRPIGYRTNPANDAAPYGRLKLTGQGIWAQVESHGAGACIISRLASDIFTLGFCNSGWQNVGNGTQVFWQIDSQGNNAATSIPTGLTILQKYYIVNCSGCGSASGTFQLSATSGGAAITGMTCTGTCIVGALNINEGLQVNTSTSTITAADAFTVMGNNTPVYVASSGLQLNTLTNPASALPSPLQLDTLYYMVNVSGRNFQLSATSGGSPITLTTIGTGPFQMSDARAPHDWAFRGLELIQAAGHFIQGGMYIFGLGNEASALGVVSHVEVDRNWIHEDPSQESTPTGPQRGIADNAAYGNYHDNYIAGMSSGEAQAIAGWGSPGPTTITNNFLEGSGENTLYGGAVNSSGLSNANKTFSGNYFYKPPAWRIDSGTGTPSGACWYDNYDPNHTGGQWFTRTGDGQVFRCTSGGTWATTGATPPSAYFIKTMAEHKSLRNSTYVGNVFAYNWGSAQSGQMFNMGQQQGSGPGMANDTITVKNNKATHVLMMGNFFADSCFMTAAVPCQTALLPHNFTITNNLVVQEQVACGVPSAGAGVGPSGCGWHMFGMQHSGFPATTFTFDHNTLLTLPDSISVSFPWDASASFWQPTSGMQFDRWAIKNSIIGYDFVGDGGSCGTVFGVNFTHTNVDRIANPNAGCGSYTGVGATNTFTNWSPQTGNAGVGFVDLTSGDYHLSASSPYSAACSSGCAFSSSDGTDIGADIDAINMATSGALAGTPPWDMQAQLMLTTGSTKLVFRYQAPNAAACTATLYNAPARVTGHQVTSVADSGASSISDALTRQLYISGLSASAHYWYKLACGGGILMIGDFVTRPTGSGTYAFTFDWSVATAIRYSSSASMSNPTTLSAATRQSIPVASDSVVYVQVGATGPITILIAP